MAGSVFGTKRNCNKAKTAYLPPLQELARADPEAEPETADAFEALVAGQPDSSHAWIRYMAFLLTLGDADGARALADRALNTINYRCGGTHDTDTSCEFWPCC